MRLNCAGDVNRLRFARFRMQYMDVAHNISLKRLAVAKSDGKSQSGVRPRLRTSETTLDRYSGVRSAGRHFRSRLHSSEVPQSKYRIRMSLMLENNLLHAENLFLGQFTTGSRRRFLSSDELASTVFPTRQQQIYEDERETLRQELSPSTAVDKHGARPPVTDFICRERGVMRHFLRTWSRTFDSLNHRKPTT